MAARTAAHDGPDGRRGVERSLVVETKRLRDDNVLIRSQVSSGQDEHAGHQVVDVAGMGTTRLGFRRLGGTASTCMGQAFPVGVATGLIGTMTNQISTTATLGRPTLAATADSSGTRTMRAASFIGPGRIETAEVPYPTIVEPTDAIVRVVLTCVCGSDLWPYRGASPQGQAIGHEFIGLVEEIGADVETLQRGDFVIAPFAFSCGECANCLAGITTACINGGFWAANGIGGGQAEAVRVPLADGTLVRVPGRDHSDDMLRSLLALSDVMGTGHHAAVSAGVGKGTVVAVVGDGAVGLSAVLAARRLGATRTIALSRHPSRQALAREYGASDVVAERGEAAIEAVLALTDGIGVDAALECVGTDGSMSTAIGITRAGGSVGYVGVPHGVTLPVETLFFRNIGVRGGPAPVRAYLPELLEAVLAGRIDPGRVFDFETELGSIADAYAAMDERRAIKALVRIDSVERSES